MFSPSTRCYTSRIQKGTLMWGEELWARMVEKNVGRDIRSYNTRLLGLALEKKSEEMVKFLEELKGNRRFKRDVFHSSLPWPEDLPV